MLLSIAILLIIWGAYLIGKKYKDSFFLSAMAEAKED